jgi:hypothetical protein
MLPEDSLKVTELALPPALARLATKKHVESADAVGRAIELKPAFETLGTEMLGRPFRPELESVGRNPLVGCVMCFPLPDKSAQYATGSPLDTATVPLLFCASELVLLASHHATRPEIAFGLKPLLVFGRSSRGFIAHITE